LKSQIPSPKSQILITSAFIVALGLNVFAQGRGAAPGRAGGPPATARAAAPFDPTGYWVAIISEDWRWRMVTPAKGDVVSIPLSAEALRLAEAWDPAKDEAAGEQCKAYGAPGLMRGPTRLHITWQDDNTLRLDTDSGTQTRLFRFGGSPPANEKPSWQGYSAATWGGDEPRDRRDGQGGPVQDKEGRLVVDKAQQRTADYLQVVTTRLRPGYLQKNGVPYSANAVVEEYFDVFSDPYTKNTWLGVTTMVTDPQYLIEPLIMHAHFKKLPDASGWDPTPCRANEPR
jgi:hypothetical protein